VLSNGTEVARYKYDPLGRRIEKVVGTDVHAWLYDGEDILRESEGAITFGFVHGPGIDEPLSRVASTGVVIYGHTDGLGSVIKMTNSLGQVIFTRQYDAFGNLEVGATQGSYAFTGREWEPETGLYYYRARYYDPKIGRFISEDPIGFTAGVNFYAYVDNSPVNKTDPLGLRPGKTGWQPPCEERIYYETMEHYCANGKHAPNDPSCRVAHCIFNCEVKRQCTLGNMTGPVINVLKEVWDEFKQQTFDPTSEGWSSGDRNANRAGRCAANLPGTCPDLCKVVR
jgi:RHS repeat-associated protein